MKDLLTKFAAGETRKITKDGTIQPVGNKNTDLVKSITDIINVVIGILGIICVVVIIIGGVGYMTSAGDSGKVKKAKDTILYGIIGLVVCVLAFAIVNFVIKAL